MARSQLGMRLLLALLIALTLAACASSPEAGRPRGAGLGSGADPRNYPPGGPVPASKVFVGVANQEQEP